MDRADGESASNDLPWASVFDPAANVRALSAIQADGFRAASELVERFVRMASAGFTGTDPSAVSESRDADGQRSDLFGATGLEPLVTSWWAMFDQFLRAGASRSDEATSPAAATLDLSTGQTTGRLSWEATQGSAATAEVWLHNGRVDDLGEVRLRCSDLLSHNGIVISAQKMRFEPDVVTLAARTSRGVLAAIEIDGDIPPGSYHGTLLVDGHPGIWLAVELVVRPLTP